MGEMIRSMWGWIFVIVLGLFGILLLVLVSTFFSRVWCYVNKLPINKKSVERYWNAYCIPVLTLYAIGIIGTILIPIGFYFKTSWEHINRPPSNIIANCEPRLPWLEYFEKELGMKNPKIFYIGIKSNILHVQARDEDGSFKTGFASIEYK
jgi:hypothetical protein